MKDQQNGKKYGNERIRSFVAIPLEGHDLISKVSRIACELGAIKGIKSVSPENLHITLKFLGDIDSGNELDHIIEGLEKVAVRHDTFRLDFRGSGTFPNINRMKVIWIGIEGHGLNDLAEDILRTLPVKEGERKQRFKPHMTIGRVKYPDGTDRAKKLVRKNQDHDFGSMNVNGFKLMKSILTPSGPIYEPIREFSFQID